MKKLKVACLPAICAASLCLTAQAEDWEIELSPYLFATGLSGDTGVNNVVGEVDMSFSDIWSNLDSAFMGAFDISNGKWSFLGDTLFAKLKDEETKSWQGPGGIGSLTGNLDATITENVYHLAVAYRVSGDSESKVDLFAGARYTKLENDLDLTFTTGGLLPGGSTNIGTNESWVDPLIGVRILTPMSEDWSFLTYLDYGFGSGESDGSYQAMLGFNWQTASFLTLKFGYRYLDWDYADDGSGYVWDMTMDGFYFGVGFRF